MFLLLTCHMPQLCEDVVGRVLGDGAVVLPPATLHRRKHVRKHVMVISFCN